MKKALLISCIFATATALSQTSFKKNDIYLEAGGNGLFGSVNYERQVTNSPGLGVRVGVGFYSEKAFYLTVPVGLNYLFPLKNRSSFIDAGLGVTWTRLNGEIFGNAITSNREHFANFIPSLGYRRHTTKNVMWRISATPIINKWGLVPWIGASVGKRF